MERRDINPTPWMQGFGLNHGVEVTAGQRVLYLSGQVAVDADAELQHAGDLAGQFALAWRNLTDCLAAADMTPGDVVRLNMYTTDVDAFMGAAGELMPLLGSAGCAPVSTLLGVARLFHPDAMIELEATVVA